MLKQFDAINLSYESIIVPVMNTFIEVVIWYIL